MYDKTRVKRPCVTTNLKNTYQSFLVKVLYLKPLEKNHLL